MADAAPRPQFSPPVSPRDSTPDAPCQVGDLGRSMRDYIARLGSPWVEGEITEWNQRAVGTFATLRDLSGDAAVRLVVWSSVRNRIPKDIAVGDRVVVCVKPEYRVQRGELSFVVSSMKHVGLGDLLEKLELLRRTLREEGLFDPARKRRLPFLPHRIGLITGRATDAEKDVLRNAELRWPHVEFRVEHASVQGDRCVPDVLAALRTLDLDPAVDVIIIARGGGDFQDLLPFSDERLLRAVAALDTPVVSAIGHENDRPLLDEVADLRASTPTDAAKRVVPDVSEQLAAVRDARARITNRLSSVLTHHAHTIEQLRSRPVLRQPERLLHDRQLVIEQALSRTRAAARLAWEQAGGEVARLRATLTAISPQLTLERGYAIVQRDGDGIVRAAADAPDGTPLHVRLADGTITAISGGPAPAESSPGRN
ncbi:exodeoxyribonuclease VII large subunit [Microbacterium gorillae]|uniref:exodeoxyribonuclease VII large subunit n=1 Tax=Microbacterium gorillae TaxID=1231063 RepID=UPI00058FE4F2|nr:exodeoxyribonuclease VII large subunit [Microbacterium gorillae]